MAEPDLQRALTSVAERLRTELDLAAVTISFGREQTLRAQADTGEPESLALARDALGLPDMLLASGTGPTGGEARTNGALDQGRAARRAAKRSDRVRRVPIALRGQEVGTDRSGGKSRRGRRSRGSRTACCWSSPTSWA